MNRCGVDEFSRLCDYDWHGRLMFGTDLPVWQSHEDLSLTRRYREYARAFCETCLLGSACQAFCDFARVPSVHGRAL